MYTNPDRTAILNEVIYICVVLLIITIVILAIYLIKAHRKIDKLEKLTEQNLNNEELNLLNKYRELNYDGKKLVDKTISTLNKSEKE